MPKRIQRRRSKGWRIPDGAVIVDRTTQWGNPFVPGKSCMYLPGRIVEDKRHAYSLYLGFAPQNEQLISAARQQLVGKDLACWCSLCDLHADGLPMGESCPWCQPCHADVLLRIANGSSVVD